MRSMHWALLTVVLIAFAAVADAHASLVIRSENFDVDPGWSLVGSGLNGNSFGYRTSNFAGGAAAGEAGGRFTRSAFVKHYGDTDLGGILDFRTHKIRASGRFDYTARNIPDFGGHMMIGHFRPGGLGRIGINFTDASFRGDLYWQSRIVLDDGLEIFGAALSIAPNQNRLWSYEWDPTGGVFGHGRFQLTFDGVTQNIDLNAALSARGFSVNAFGFNGSPASTSRSNFDADMFMDDVKYSTAEVVPEPGAVAVWGLFLALLGCMGVTRRRSQNRRFSGNSLPEVPQ